MWRCTGCTRGAGTPEQHALSQPWVRDPRTAACATGPWTAGDTDAARHEMEVPAEVVTVDLVHVTRSTFSCSGRLHTVLASKDADFGSVYQRNAIVLVLQTLPSAPGGSRGMCVCARAHPRLAGAGAGELDGFSGNGGGVVDAARRWTIGCDTSRMDDACCGVSLSVVPVQVRPQDGHDALQSRDLLAIPCRLDP